MNYDRKEDEEGKVKENCRMLRCVRGFCIFLSWRDEWDGIILCWGGGIWSLGGTDEELWILWPCRFIFSGGCGGLGLGLLSWWRIFCKLITRIRLRFCVRFTIVERMVVFLYGLFLAFSAALAFFIGYLGTNMKILITIW